MEAIKLIDLPNGKVYDSFKIQILRTLPDYYEIRDGQFVIANVHFGKNETRIISNDGVKIVSRDNWQEIVNEIDEVIYIHLFEEKTLFSEK